MASLANVTFELRLVLKILAGLAGVLLILFFIFKGGAFIKKAFFPDPPPPPDQRFGKLPDAAFPIQEKGSIGFKVNTTSGELPVFPDRAKVYKNKGYEPSLTALQDTREKVARLYFTNREEKTSETSFQWSRASGETIAIDIYTNDFSVDSNFLAFPEQYQTGSFSLTKENITEAITGFLSSLDIDISDFRFESTRIRYYKITSAGLEQVESQNSAQIARIDLFQNPVDEKPIFYPEYNGSTMHFFVGVREGQIQIAKAEFHQHRVNKEESSIYPIITVQKALDDLSRGKGLVLSEKPLESQTFQITNVTLSYYYGTEDTGFLTPVYVFYGSDFFAIVSALPPESILDRSN